MTVRKTIPLQAAGKLSLRDRMWAGMRSLGEFTRDDLFAWCAKNAPKGAAARCIDERTIASYVLALAAGGYLAVVATASGRYEKKTYALVRDVGVHAPHIAKDGRTVTLGDGCAQLWNGMRRLKRFDCRDLIVAAAAKVAYSTARNYCIWLHKAAYIAIDTPARPGAPARYRLVRDTGPRAPVIQRKKHVYDPNLGEVVWHPEVNS